MRDGGEVSAARVNRKASVKRVLAFFSVVASCSNLSTLSFRGQR